MNTVTQAWIRHALQHPVAVSILRQVRPLAVSPWYPLLAGALAFAGGISMTVPNAPLVCALVALDTARWRRIAFCMATGSALSTALIAFLIEHWGRELLANTFPEVLASSYWSHLITWVDAWGIAVLVVVTALPVSQTPAVFAAAFLGMSTSVIFLAVLAGKVVKYGVLAYLTTRSAHAFDADFLAP